MMPLQRLTQIWHRHIEVPVTSEKKIIQKKISANIIRTKAKPLQVTWAQITVSTSTLTVHKQIMATCYSRYDNSFTTGQYRTYLQEHQLGLTLWLQGWQDTAGMMRKYVREEKWSRSKRDTGFQDEPKTVFHPRQTSCFLRTLLSFLRFLNKNPQ